MKNYREKLSEDEITTGMLGEFYKLDYRLINNALKMHPKAPAPSRMFGKIAVYDVNKISTWIAYNGGEQQFSTLVYDLWATTVRNRRASRGTPVRGWNKRTPNSILTSQENYGN